MHEDFEIQTLGRIRRMPEAKHYGNELLDNCYLYTFDDQYTESVKQELGRNAANVKALFVRDEYRKFKLTKKLKILRLTILHQEKRSMQYTNTL